MIAAGGRSRRPATLRTRLLFTIATLSSAISLAVGGIALLALHRMAVDGVDAQLTNVYQRSLTPPNPAPSADLPPAGLTATDRLHSFLERPGQAVGTLAAEIDGGSRTPRATAAVLDPSGTAVDLDAAAAGALVAHTSTQPATVTLAGWGDYRVAAAPAPRDSGFTVLVGLPLTDVQTTVYRLAGVLAVVTLLGVGAVLAVGSALLRVALRPLDRVRATATRVAELPLERGDVVLAERVPDADPRTEVGQVGAALNRMLEHIASALAARQASETRLRRFAADASHELRTPLASVRGYAELMRRRPEPLPADVARAVGRVESEAARMGALVEDMLLLARLDEHRPLARHVIDLTRVVTEVAQDAMVTGPAHEWRLHVPRQEVTVLGDAARLTQVLVNLLANARAHTPAGTTVHVTLSVEPPAGGGPDGHQQAVLVVQDDGPGMAADLAAEAFQRFTRADESRSRTAGSTGLGLAIVDAVIRAHGGSAQLDSVTGAGTTVTVRLPATVLGGITDDRTHLISATVKS